MVNKKGKVKSSSDEDEDDDFYNNNAEDVEAQNEVFASMNENTQDYTASVWAYLMVVNFICCWFRRSFLVQ